MFSNNANVLSCKGKSLCEFHFHFSVIGKTKVHANQMQLEMDELKKKVEAYEIEKEKLKNVIKSLSSENKKLKMKIEEYEELNSMDTTIGTIYEPIHTESKTNKMLYLKKKILDNKSPCKMRTAKKLSGKCITNNNGNNMNNKIGIPYLNLSKLLGNTNQSNLSFYTKHHTENNNNNNCNVLTNSKYIPIIEKKVSLSQKKLALLNTPKANSKHTFDRTHQKKSQSNNIEYTPLYILNEHREINNKHRCYNGSEIYRIDISLESIISFNTETFQFTKTPYKRMNNSFYSIYKEEGSSSISNKHGLFILTGSTYQLLYKYDPKVQTITKHSQLTHSHWKSNLTSYNEDVIICIGGISSLKVEMINVNRQSSWESLPDLNILRSEFASIVVNDILFVMFGYDYSKNCYINSIEYLDMKKPTEWKLNKISSEVKIRNFGLICDKENSERFVLIGGNKETDLYLNSLIEIYNCGNDNYIINNVDDISKDKSLGIFSMNFVDVSTKLKFGFDTQGNVHMFDLEYFKHEVHLFA